MPAACRVIQPTVVAAGEDCHGVDVRRGDGGGKGGRVKVCGDAGDVLAGVEI